MSRDNVRGLTLWQPWASLVVMGEKKIETRAWLPNVNGKPFRGTLLIHAAKESPEEEAIHVMKTKAFSDVCKRQGVYASNEQFLRIFPAGAIVGTVRVHDAGEQFGIYVSGEDSVIITNQAGFVGALPMSPHEHIFGYYNTEQKFGEEAWRKLWHLVDPVRFEKPILCSGNRRLWIPSEQILQQVEAQGVEL